MQAWHPMHFVWSTTLAQRGGAGVGIAVVRGIRGASQVRVLRTVPIYRPSHRISTVGATLSTPPPGSRYSSRRVATRPNSARTKRRKRERDYRHQNQHGRRDHKPSRVGHKHPQGVPRRRASETAATPTSPPPTSIPWHREPCSPGRPRPKDRRAWTSPPSRASMPPRTMRK